MLKTGIKYLTLGLLVLIYSCKDRFPPSVFETGNLNLGSAYDLCVEDAYAYVSYNDGLAIIDFSSPDHPVLIETVKTEEAAFGVLLDNDTLFIGAGGRSNLKIVDVSNKINPRVISSTDVSGTTYDIVRKGHYLFLSTWEGKFITVDIENRNSPQIISNLDCFGNGTNLGLKNDIIYFANPQKGIQIIDIANPSEPEIRSVVQGSSGAWDIHIDNEYLFLGKHSKGFSIFEIQNNYSLFEIYSGSNGGETYGIFRDGDRLCIGDLQQGVEIWDITIMEEPELIETIDEYSPHDLVVNNGSIFLADQDRNFVILDY